MVISIQRKKKTSGVYCPVTKKKKKKKKMRGTHTYIYPHKPSFLFSHLLCASIPAPNLPLRQKGFFYGAQVLLSRML